MYLYPYPSHPTRKMCRHSEFARLLNHYLQTQDRDAAWLASRLRLNRSTVSRWLNGETRPRTPETVERIADILGVFDSTARRALHDAYRGGTRRSSPSSSPSGDGGRVVPPHNPASSPNLAPLNFTLSFIEAARQWWDEFFRWEEAPPENVDTWEGRVLYGLGVLTERITPEAAFAFLVALAFWILTAWLLTPILRWPLEPASARLDACIRFAVASILVPLSVALVTPPAHLDLRQTDVAGWHRRGLLLFLKMTGSLVAFSVFAAATLALALIGFYLGFAPWPQAVSWLLAGFPLFFCYVVARRIPVERYRMFGGVLRSHPADRLFFAVFFFLGPVLAGFIYLEYPILVQPWFGFLLLLIVTGWTWWRSRR